MSFPRAKIKRFNDVHQATPPPGLYSPNYPYVGKSDSYTFNKTHRFPAQSTGSATIRTVERPSPSTIRCSLSSTPNLLGTYTRKQTASSHTFIGSTKSLLEPLSSYKDLNRPSSVPHSSSQLRARSVSPHTLRERMTRTKEKLEDVGFKIETSQKTISATKEKLGAAQSDLHRLCNEIDDTGIISKSHSASESVRQSSSHALQLNKVLTDTNVVKMSKTKLSAQSTQESLDEVNPSEANYILPPHEEFDIKNLEQMLLGILQIVSELITDILVSRDKVMTAFTAGLPRDKRKQKLAIDELEADRASLEIKLASSKKDVEDKFRSVNTMVHKLWDNSRTLLSAISSGGVNDMASKQSKTITNRNRSRSPQACESIMVKKLKEAETRARNFHTHIQSLEQQINQLKNSESTIQTESKEKEAQIREEIATLKTSLSESTEKNKRLIKKLDGYKKKVLESGKGVDYVELLQGTTEKLTEAETNLEIERKQTKELNDQLVKYKVEIAEVIASRDRVCDVMQTMKDEALALTTPQQSEQEVRLTMELQAARLMLKTAKEELAIARENNDKMVAAALGSNEGLEGETTPMIDSVPAEFLVKLLESNVRSLLVENQGLRKTVEEIRVQMHETNSKLYGESAANEVAAQIKNWQRKVRTLESQLANAEANFKQSAEKTTDVEKRLAQCQIELEQRDCVVQEQSRVIRARDELLVSMQRSQERGEEPLPLPKEDLPTIVKMTASDDSFKVDLPTGTEPEDIDQIKETMKSIIKKAEQKARDLIALKAILEQKQMQINRLQAAVNLMEAQQERAQAQRTRQESRVAQLEHELQEKEGKIQSLVKTGHSMLRAWRRSST